MNDNPSPAGSPPEPDPQEITEESPTRESESTEPEVHPPEPVGQSSSQNLPAAPRQGWVSKVLGGRGRRDQQLQTLQSGYVEMLDMMRSISNHLDRQAYNQDQLMKTLDHFPEAVDGLRNVGKATQQQTVVLGMVRSQLESNAKHEREIVKSMEGFNNTLNLMDETSRNTTATIGDLVESSRDAEDELRAMLERSERRLTMLTGILGVIGLMAIGGAIYFGLTQRQKSAPSPDATITQPAANDPQAIDPIEPADEDPVDERTMGLGDEDDQPDESPGATPDAELEEDGAVHPMMGAAGQDDIQEDEFLEPVFGDAEAGEPVFDGEETPLDVLPEAADPDTEAPDAEFFDPEIMDEAIPDEATMPDAGLEYADLDDAADTEDAVNEDLDAPEGEDAVAPDHDGEAVDPVADDEDAAEDAAEETEEGAMPPLMDAVEEGDAALNDAVGESDEPAGVKNVVRQFFSFLGDEDMTNTVDEAKAPAEDPGSEDAPAE